MHMRTCLLILVMTLCCGLLQAQQDPLIGTWKLNLAKSKYTGINAPKSQVIQPIAERLLLIDRLLVGASLDPYPNQASRRRYE